MTRSPGPGPQGALQRTVQRWIPPVTQEYEGSMDRLLFPCHRCSRRYGAQPHSHPRRRRRRPRHRRAGGGCRGRDESHRHFCSMGRQSDNTRDLLLACHPALSLSDAVHAERGRAGATPTYGAGLLKPVVVASAPPGAIGNYILLPLGLIALFLSLRGNSKAT